MSAVMLPLSEKLETLLRRGASAMGSFQPNILLPYIEEELTATEFNQAEAFLKCPVTNDKTFGWNLPEVYQEYLESRCSTMN